MSVSTNRRTPPRIPLEVGGIQVNFCKNPTCPNFGVPASAEKQPRGPGASQRGRDTYRVSGRGYDKREGVPAITCLMCNETPPIKSNQGVHEEKERMAAYLATPEPSCPNESCPNHSVGVSQNDGHYHRKGPTAAGSPRWICLACKRSFSINVSKPAKNHHLPHKNSEVFSLLVNMVPMRRICKIARINPVILYDKICFIHRQAMAFVARRERRLLTGEVAPEKLYLSVDRQDHLINWTCRKDKRQTQFQAIGTADNLSSYVFAIHLNYDPAFKPDAVEKEAILNGDYALRAPFRRHARLWLMGDYMPALMEKARTLNIRQDGGAQSLDETIRQAYREAAIREDVEAFDLPAEYTQLPTKGMQVHAEYTLYGHFYFLRELLQHVGKLRFFLDQESGIRAACLAAFQERIVARECDAFYVSINKTMTNDQKEQALREVEREIRKLAEEYPYDLSDASLRSLLIELAIKKRKPMGPWRDMWVDVPSWLKSEPEKKVCHLTDLGDYDESHLAALFDKASLHGIDRFFAQVRNSVSLLARAPSSASNAGRVWYQRNAYNPGVAAMLLDIYRVNYNYLEVGADKKTPAMRLGLAKSKIRLTEILTFEASSPID
jgi:transposase-like protein